MLRSPPCATRVLPVLLTFAAVALLASLSGCGPTQSGNTGLITEPLGPADPATGGQGNNAPVGGDLR